MSKSSIVIAMFLSGALLCQNIRAEDAQIVDVQKADADTKQSAASASSGPATDRVEEATFGLGCFSCAEAIFEQLRGVESVDPGYSGGKVKKPTYEQVSSGLSGHAEAVHITYDPNVISFDELLEVFWKMHDPTTPNRQGKDIGSHYRSAIFYHGDEQRKVAEDYKQKLEDAGAFTDPIVTEIKPFEAFYQAEKEHLDFYRLNPENQYCTMTIQPKMDKFKQVFAEKLRNPPQAKAEQQ
jgi:methionine-S-sulfoxide reductase